MVFAINRLIYNNQKQCKCDDCVLSSIACIFDPLSPNKPPSNGSQGEPQSSQMDLEQRAKLYEELVNFRLSLPRPGRTCVGSTSLSTGISIELINDVIENASTFTSVEEIEGRLPVFSHKTAVSIFDIVKNFIGNVNVM